MIHPYETPQELAVMAACEAVRCLDGARFGRRDENYLQLVDSLWDDRLCDVSHECRLTLSAVEGHGANDLLLCLADRLEEAAAQLRKAASQGTAGKIVAATERQIAGAA
jgi:hypothetical protein